MIIKVSPSDLRSAQGITGQPKGPQVSSRDLRSAQGTCLVENALQRRHGSHRLELPRITKEHELAACLVGDGEYPLQLFESDHFCTIDHDYMIQGQRVLLFHPGKLV